MDVDLYINGVWREVAIRSLDIKEGFNGRASLSCNVQTDDTDVPQIDDEVELILSGATTLFAGTISDADEQWLDPDGNRITRIVADDYTALADRRIVSGSTAAGVLTGRDAIDLVVTNFLAIFGVTRDPAMPAGATLGASTYEYVKASQVIDDIVRQAAPTGWFWKIDENKVLTAFAPGVGTMPCPWSLTDPTQLVGDLSVKPNRERYANRVILVYNDGTATLASVTVDDTAEQTARGIYEVALKAPGPIDATTATAIATGYLSQLKVIPRTVKFPTLEAGTRTGQTLTINLPEDSLVGDFLVTDVQTQDLDGVDLTYTVTAVEGTTNPATWKDTYRAWSGNVQSGLVSTGGVVITVSTPAPSVAPMGGSTSRAVVPGSGSWVPAEDAVPYVAPQSRSIVFRANLRARNAGITATARLRDLTAGSTVGTTSGVTGTTATLVSVAGAVVAGHRYEFQMSADANGEGVYGIASLEAA